MLQQLGVTALRNDATLVKYDDSIGLLHGRKTVSDDQSRAVVGGIVQCRLHKPFARRIERAGSFIEKQDRRILENGARNGDSLTLST